MGKQQQITDTHKDHGLATANLSGLVFHTKRIISTATQLIIMESHHVRVSLQDKSLEFNLLLCIKVDPWLE